MKLLAAIAIALCASAAPALAKPKVTKPTKTKVASKSQKSQKSEKATKATKAKPKTQQAASKSRQAPLDPTKVGAVAHVVLPKDAAHAEQETAAAIEKLLRTPLLRRGITGLHVADARTGQPLFSVNADEAMNPASNVKLISTATALDLLGPDFRYPTRLLGQVPVDGTIHGDVYLLGSYDPTLTGADLDDIAASLALRGVKRIDGNIVVGSDRTRDGIYRAIIPIEIAAGEPGEIATATVPAGFDLVEVTVEAKTSKKAHKPKLKYDTEVVKNELGRPRIKLKITGSIGKGGATMYPLWTRERTATAAYSLIAALRSRSIDITGEMKIAELGDFVGDAVANGALPVELGRHDSQTVTQIVNRVNKWSVNWLSDRLVMTAAALARHQQPSMELALDAMYSWLARHPQVAGKDPKGRVVIDTGSGLSYRTRITPHDLVAIVRAAGGFADASDKRLGETWLRSLSVAGSDGTLRNRFYNTEARGHVIGKTGSLSTVIALSGVLALDPHRPLVFSLVTNTDRPLRKPLVRRAHEQVIAELCKYIAKTSKSVAPVAAPAGPSPAGPPPIIDEPETEPGDPDSALDSETAGHS